MMNGVEANEAYEDQIDCYHEVEKAGYDENQNARDQRDERLDVVDGQIHQGLRVWARTLTEEDRAWFRKSQF
jgi:hypothetical protein